jgi:hypothetical protein
MRFTSGQRHQTFNCSFPIIEAAAETDDEPIRAPTSMRRVEFGSANEESQLEGTLGADTQLSARLHTALVDRLRPD